MTDDREAVQREASIDDRRLDEIFERRREAHELLTRTEMATHVQNTKHLRRLKATHAAVKSYIVAVEDIIRDGTKEAQHHWDNYPLGTIQFTGGPDPPTIRIDGLADILHQDPIITHTWTEQGTGFMVGEETERTETQHLPIQTLWRAYRTTTSLLAKRGFELEATQTDEWEI